MPKVVVVGGGLGGCAAAVAAARAGASVTLLERMEILGGFALLAGRVDHKYFPVREELRLMGADDLFALLDRCTLHRSVRFPLPKPGGAVKTLYDATKLDLELRKHLDSVGVEVHFQSRARSVKMNGKTIRTVVLDDRASVEGDAFVDATGGAGPTKICKKYGGGCAICIMRCPAFGDRISIVERAGIKELAGKKVDGTLGPLSATFTVLKDSLQPALREEMERNGYVVIPVPAELVDYRRTESITATGNIDKGFAENIVLVDIGSYAKSVATGYRSLEELRRLPGLERVVFYSPSAATIGLGVCYTALSPRGNALDVPGTENLFVASEKIGVNGTGEVIATGVLAGHNAARKTVGAPPLILPRTTMLGDFIAYVNERWDKEEGLRQRFHIFTGPYFQRAERAGLYTEDKDAIRVRVAAAGLLGVFSSNVVSRRRAGKLPERGRH